MAGSEPEGLHRKNRTIVDSDHPVLVKKKMDNPLRSEDENQLVMYGLEKQPVLESDDHDNRAAG